MPANMIAPTPGQAEGDRQQHRDRRCRPEARQHADQRAEKNARQAVEQVLQRERGVQAQTDIRYEFQGEDLPEESSLTEPAGEPATDDGQRHTQTLDEHEHAEDRSRCGQHQRWHPAKLALA